jgi:hypothetical protein
VKSRQTALPPWLRGSYCQNGKQAFGRKLTPRFRRQKALAGAAWCRQNVYEQGPATGLGIPPCGKVVWAPLRHPRRKPLNSELQSGGGAPKVMTSSMTKALPSPAALAAQCGTESALGITCGASAGPALKKRVGLEVVFGSRVNHHPELRLTRILSPRSKLALPITALLFSMMNSRGIRGSTARLFFVQNVASSPRLKVARGVEKPRRFL